MKTVFKILFFTFIFLCLSFKSFAYQIGVFEIYDSSNPVMEFDFQNNKTVNVSKSKLSSINSKDFPVLIFSKYSLVDDTVYNEISSYLRNGGKIILFTPNSQTEFPNFKRMAKLVGVNVEKISTAAEATDINWVEKTLYNNTLKAGKTIAKVSLYSETEHLAVFGDIEKHETAISKNHNGVFISWRWGFDGDRQFNEKSMKYILETLIPLPKVTASSNIQRYIGAINSNEDITLLRDNRDYIENYQDNIINYSKDISIPQQELELSKINELWANYYAKNGNADLYKKYLNLADKNVFNATVGINNLSPAETRGVWFDRGTIVNIKSKSEMGRYFDKLKMSGINTVYFETVNAGYTIYPTRIGSQNPLTKGKDPLAWAIDEAHARKMKLQAWVWVFASGNDRHNKIINKPMTYPGPVLEKNLRWALLGENGNFRPKNQPEFWIDPSNREGVKFLLNLIDEIVNNYNVDGIQLDYIRYPFQSSDNLMGFNHNSTEQFACKTGEKMFDNDYRTNILWNKWKEDNINSFVKKVSTNLKRKKSSLKISAAIFSKTQDYRLGAIQQNYENWLANSYVDFLTPMSYSSTLSALKTNINPLKSQIDVGLIYPGIALQHVNQVEILKQTSLLRENGFAGVSFFAVAQLTDDKADFLSDTFTDKNACDVAYNKIYAAKLILEDYKIMLNTLKNIQYDLSQIQKTEIDSLLTYTNAAIVKINNKQFSSAVVTLKELERRNDEFFTKFSNYNPQRKQTAKSYIKRAENLIKVSIKRGDN